MNVVLNSAIKKIARKYSVSPELVLLIYKSYWNFIKTSISSLPLEEMTEADFEKIPTNFNIPYIGKLYTSYSKIIKHKNQLNYYRENVRAKKNTTNVLPSSCD